jgi:hypothetical protein
MTVDSVIAHSCPWTKCYGLLQSMGFERGCMQGALKSVDTEAYGFLQSMGYHSLGYDRVDCIR